MGANPRNGISHPPCSKRRLVTITCVCGKRTYATREEAEKVIEQSSELKRVYHCVISNSFHVTKKKHWQIRDTSNTGFYFNPEKLLRELKDEMAKKTLKQVIVDHMKEAYEQDLVYKFSSNMIYKYCQTIYPRIGKTHVYGEITGLKKMGEIVNLDEKVPDQRGAKYFALSSVIDRITTPSNTSDGNKTVTTEVTKATPATVASNPFDKVNSTLGEILTKVNGLVNAYTEVANDLRGLRKSTVSSGVETSLDIANLAEILNDRLSDLTKENSLIYRLRDDASEFVDELKKELPEEILKLLPQLDYGSEDYKRGIRDGIKLAVEMGLNSSNV